VLEQSLRCETAVVLASVSDHISSWRTHSALLKDWICMNMSRRCSSGRLTTMKMQNDVHRGARRRSFGIPSTSNSNGLNLFVFCYNAYVMTFFAGRMFTNRFPSLPDFRFMGVFISTADIFCSTACRIRTPKAFPGF
jgi:hypothetical protein